MDNEKKDTLPLSALSNHLSKSNFTVFSSSAPYDAMVTWCVDGNWCGKSSCPINPRHIKFIDYMYYHWERFMGTDICPLNMNKGESCGKKEETESDRQEKI